MEWREIKFTSGKYFISEYGDVESRFRQSKHKKTYITHRLNPCSCKKKYLRASLWYRNNGASVNKREYIHRLVAIAFVPNINNKPHINHIDGNKLNNHYSNLEWCTPQENNEHGFKIGLLKRGRTVKPYVSKRTEWGGYKPIIDLETGIFYKTEELANIIDVTIKHLRKTLAGERKNLHPRYVYS